MTWPPVLSCIALLFGLRTTMTLLSFHFPCSSGPFPPLRAHGMVCSTQGQSTKGCANAASKNVTQVTDLSHTWNFKFSCSYLKNKNKDKQEKLIRYFI